MANGGSTTAIRKTRSTWLRWKGARLLVGLAGHLAFSVEPLRALKDASTYPLAGGLIHPAFRVHAVVFPSETRLLFFLGRAVLLIGVGNALFIRNTVHFTTIPRVLRAVGHAFVVTDKFLDFFFLLSEMKR